ncbi:MAG: small subunit ribosomal protein [Thermotogaceae bacterium]|jgi:small subunit ribosomal protein S20|nr:small subunit ribosomal protein [Thermotogaceae bacterium]
MPNIKSAVKRVKTSEKRRVLNKFYRGRFKNLVKALNKAIEANEIERVKELYPKAVSAIDKAAKHGTIHKRQAARRKSRLASKVNKLLSSQA